MAWPFFEKPVICRLVSVDHVRDQCPVETRVSMPVIYPSHIAFYVELAALLPYRERAVIKNERLAHVSNNPHVIAAREWDKRVPASQEARPVLPVTAYWGAVVMNYGATLRLRPVAIR